MPVAVPLIVGSISLASGMYAAHKQASAANHAADLQSAATDKAQAFNQQVYNDQRHDLQPFVQGGTSAFQQLLGNWQARQPGGGAQPGLPTPFSGQAPSPFGQAMGGSPMPAPPQPPNGGAVMLRAPDGSTQSVPAQFADQFIAKGAVRV